MDNNIGNRKIFGNNLAFYLERSGKTQKEVADIVGVAPSTVHAWLQGSRYPRMDKVELLAELFGIRKTDLIEAPGQMSDLLTAIPNLLPLRVQKLPLLGEIACGEPLLAEEHIEIYVAAGDDLHADFCLRAKGDSMIGARIHDGDIVFVRKQDTVEDGEIAAVLIDGEATLKRVYYDREQGILSLYAENPRFRTMHFSGPRLDQIRILGKAVAFQSPVK